MVPFSNLHARHTNRLLNTSLDFSVPSWTISLPNSLEAWIQQSLNKEAEVVRDLPPAMSASVRRTASNSPPEKKVVKSQLGLSKAPQNCLFVLAYHHRTFQVNLC